MRQARKLSKDIPGAWVPEVSISGRGWSRWGTRRLLLLPMTITILIASERLLQVSSQSKELQELNLCLPHYLHPCVFASFSACAIHWGKDLLMQKLEGRQVPVLLLVN